MSVATAVAASGASALTGSKMERFRRRTNTEDRSGADSSVVLRIDPSPRGHSSPAPRRSKKEVDESKAAVLLVNADELVEIKALLDRRQKAYKSI